jgi:hypothetical protein
VRRGREAFEVLIANCKIFFLQKWPLEFPLSLFGFFPLRLRDSKIWLPMMNTFAALNLLCCLFFASFLIPVSAFLFSMYLHSFFSLLFTAKAAHQ